jgi:gamma-glutamyltranspeptidase/glutathione hydrolase
MRARRWLLALLALLAFSAQALAAGTVSSADPRASEAGMAMLRKGGSATDAALAMMLALTVVEPQSSGIGGGGFLVHHDGRRNLVSTIDGRETAPRSASPALFLDAEGQPLPFGRAVPGGKSVGVPGNVALMKKAHRRWGKLPWAELFTPGDPAGARWFCRFPAPCQSTCQRRPALGGLPAGARHLLDRWPPRSRR